MNGVRRTRGSTPVPRDAQQPLQRAGATTGGSGGSWSRSGSGCPAAPTARAARRSSRRAAGRASRRRPPWPRASGWRRRRPRGTRSGRACSGCRGRRAPSARRCPRAGDRRPRWRPGGSGWPATAARPPPSATPGSSGTSARSDRRVGRLPQPWQADAISSSSSSGQIRAGWMHRVGRGMRSRPTALAGLGRIAGRRRRGVVGRARGCPAPWLRRAGFGLGTSGTRGIARRSRSIRCGSSPMTLPGLSWPIGSNASLISRKTWTSSPNCLRRNWVRARPQPGSSRSSRPPRARCRRPAVGQRLELGAVRRAATGRGTAGAAGGPRRRRRRGSR